MKTLAPYQLFFPLGIINAIIAVSVWFTQNLGWFSTPALFIHSKLIVGGFLWSFIVGFLMTAIPRMSGTVGAHRGECFLASLLLIVLSVFAWQIEARLFYMTQILLVLFLIFFGARRVLRSTKPIPVFFSHVAMAMLLAIAGSYYHFAGNAFMGLHLYHIGTTLLLVLGIGTRFFSFLSGLPANFENSDGLFRMLFHGLGILVVVFLFLAGHGVTHAHLGLFLLSLLYLVFVWQIQRPSERPSPLKYGVRIVALSIPLSFLCTWFKPHLYLAWFHILFISCFALITFSVATRVTLAHGSYSSDLEMKSKPLTVLVLLLTLSAISRVMYGFTEGLWKTSYLHLAATLWCLAIGYWSWVFLPKMFKAGPQSKPSC